MSKESTGWRRRVLLFLISQSITLFGSTLVQMAIVWYVTFYTDSGVWVAALTVCAYLPQFLMSFVGGVWADRYNRKMLIIAADSIIALVTLGLVLAIPYLQEGSPLLWAILAVFVLRSLAAGVQSPAVNAVIPQLVPEDQLMRYNGINATMQSVVQFAAPAAAGALLTFSTLRCSLLIDVLTAALGIGILSCVLIPRPPRTQQPAALLKDMKQGVHYAFSHRLLGRLLAVYAVFIFLCVPAGFLATLLVSRVYGETYWFLTAVEVVGFIGMAGGGLLMSTWGGFSQRGHTLCLGLAAFGALAVGMGFSRVFILYLGLMLLYGVALTVVQTAVITMIQEQAAPDMQGRAFGLMGSIYSGALPIGMIVFGPLADVIPLTAVMIGSGVALLFLAGLCQIRRWFRVSAPALDNPAEAIADSKSDLPADSNADRS